MAGRYTVTKNETVTTPGTGDRTGSTAEVIVTRSSKDFEEITCPQCRGEGALPAPGHIQDPFLVTCWSCSGAGFVLRIHR